MLRPPILDDNYGLRMFMVDICRYNYSNIVFMGFIHRNKRTGFPPSCRKRGRWSWTPRKAPGEMIVGVPEYIQLWILTYSYRVRIPIVVACVPATIAAVFSCLIDTVFGPTARKKWFHLSLLLARLRVQVLQVQVGKVGEVGREPAWSLHGDRLECARVGYLRLARLDETGDETRLAKTRTCSEFAFVCLLSSCCSRTGVKFQISWKFIYPKVLKPSAH